mmetsp:Transcript_6530/g.19813  ORF Transcript_6530/g.19813 Transcript_6530/m.19813 type:complete len:153 (+) Transcript_6530:151-609(+)
MQSQMGSKSLSVAQLQSSVMLRGIQPEHLALLERLCDAPLKTTAAGLSASSSANTAARPPTLSTQATVRPSSTSTPGGLSPLRRHHHPLLPRKRPHTNQRDELDENASITSLESSVLDALQGHPLAGEKNNTDADEWLREFLHRSPVSSSQE